MVSFIFEKIFEAVLTVLVWTYYLTTTAIGLAMNALILPAILFAVPFYWVYGVLNRQFRREV